MTKCPSLLCEAMEFNLHSERLAEKPRWFSGGQSSQQAGCPDFSSSFRTPIGPNWLSDTRMELAPGPPGKLKASGGSRTLVWAHNVSIAFCRHPISTQLSLLPRVGTKVDFCPCRISLSTWVTVSISLNQARDIRRNTWSKIIVLLHPSSQDPFVSLVSRSSQEV